MPLTYPVITGWKDGDRASQRLFSCGCLRVPCLPRWNLLLLTFVHRPI